MPWKKLSLLEKVAIQYSATNVVLYPALPGTIWIVLMAAVQNQPLVTYAYIHMVLLAAVQNQPLVTHVLHASASKEKSSETDCVSSQVSILTCEFLIYFR
jgi:hypothetical protein